MYAEHCWKTSSGDTNNGGNMPRITVMADENGVPVLAIMVSIPEIIKSVQQASGLNLSFLAQGLKAVMEQVKDQFTNDRNRRK